jgi:parallel beta-helix repeat protein
MLVCSLNAETIYVSGDVTGVWDADTVFVEGEIRVPYFEDLIIEPGTMVFFLSNCKFIIDFNATITAQGTIADSIFFQAFAPNENWRGFRFLESSDSCRLSYCQIQDGYAQGTADDWYGGGIYCHETNLNIQNCRFNNCTAEMYGGAIYTFDCSVTISQCLFHDNSAFFGGAVYNRLYGIQTATIQSCTFNTNYAEDGSAIFVLDGQSQIHNNEFTNNPAPETGMCVMLQAGIHCVTENNIYDNGGIGLHSFAADSVLIASNYLANHPRAGIFCESASRGILADNEITGNGNTGLTLDTADPIVTNNEIYSNYSQNGGGIYTTSGSNAIITNNYIWGNTADNEGGGIYLSACSAAIGNEIAFNIAGGRGGGIYTGSPYQPQIENNLIIENEATFGGGLAFGVQVEGFQTFNNTICGNTASSGQGGGVHLWHPAVYQPKVILANCILWDNIGTNVDFDQPETVLLFYCDIQGGWAYGGRGNIETDPLFAGSSDFHLADNSPCIGAGTDSVHIGHFTFYMPSNDIEGNPRPDPLGSAPDIGAYENPLEAPLGLNRAPVTGQLGYLIDCHPNRFNPTTVINYQLPVVSQVSLEIYDISGRLVESPLHDVWRAAGHHEVVFDGSGLASGIYIYQFRVSSGSGAPLAQATPTTGTGKMVLIK